MESIFGDQTLQMYGNFGGFPLISVNFRGFPLIIVNFRGFPLIIVNLGRISPFISVTGWWFHHISIQQKKD